MREGYLIRRVLLFLCVFLQIDPSFCYAERLKSYARGNGAVVNWYKRCDSNGQVRENYSYDLKR